MCSFDIDEIQYLVNVLEVDIYRRNETIKKVINSPFQYIDDVSELKEKNVFVRGIIAKLQSGSITE